MAGGYRHDSTQCLAHLFPSVLNHQSKVNLFYVWCDDGSGCVFSVAVCKTEKEADSTRGLFAALEPTSTFTITKGLD